MSKLDELIWSLEDQQSWNSGREGSDADTLLKCLYDTECRKLPISIETGVAALPPLMLAIAKLLQRIDKLEDEFHELRSRID